MHQLNAPIVASSTPTYDRNTFNDIAEISEMSTREKYSFQVFIFAIIADLSSSAWRVYLNLI